MFAGFLNSFASIYLLALGEFDVEDYSSRGTFSQILLWLLFIFFTFMLQITFMNMLIAIMTKTFDDVTKKSRSSSITERISILNDYSFFLDLFKLDLDAQFLFVIVPSSQDFVTDTVEEKLEEITQTIQKQ